MKLRSNLSMVALGALALGAIAATPAAAATPKPVPGLAGEFPSSVAGCPDIHWRVARHDDMSITGMFWYGDMSGSSEVTGHREKDGQFHIELRSVIGDGPVGMIDGIRSPDNKIVADLKGPGCANMHFVMDPSLDIRRYIAR